MPEVPVLQGGCVKTQVLGPALRNGHGHKETLKHEGMAPNLP